MTQSEIVQTAVRWMVRFGGSLEALVINPKTRDLRAIWSIESDDIPPNYDRAIAASMRDNPWLWVTVPHQDPFAVGEKGIRAIGYVELRGIMPLYDAVAGREIRCVRAHSSPGSLHDTPGEGTLIYAANAIVGRRKARAQGIWSTMNERSETASIWWERALIAGFAQHDDGVDFAPLGSFAKLILAAGDLEPVRMDYVALLAMDPGEDPVIVRWFVESLETSGAPGEVIERYLAQAGDRPAGKVRFGSRTIPPWAMKSNSKLPSARDIDDAFVVEFAEYDDLP